MASRPTTDDPSQPANPLLKKKVNEEAWLFFQDQLLSASPRNTLQLTPKSMFGGIGVYGIRVDGPATESEPIFFALIFGGTLYFKVNDETRPAFEGHGMGYFQPSETIRLTSYYQVPLPVLEDPDQLAQWAFESYQVGKIAARQKPAKKPPSPVKPSHL